MKKKKRIRGSVSLLLAIVMVPMLAFGGIAADFAAISAARSEAEAACALAVNGILSSYHRKLYEMYGIFAFSESPEEAALLGMQYLENSMNPVSVFDRQDVYTTVQKARLGGADGFSGLLRLTPVGFSVDPVPASSPANPTVLENRILSFMKVRGPLVLGESVLERFRILDTLEGKSQTAAAKLRHDSSLGKADDAARALNEAVNAYYEALHSPFFQPELPEGLRKTYAEDRLLLTAETEADKLLSASEELSSRAELASHGKKTADSAAILRFSGEELRKMREETVRTLPRMLSGSDLPDTGTSADTLSRKIEDCRRRADTMQRYYPEIIGIYSSALAVKHTLGGLSEKERTRLAEEGADAGRAEETAEAWIESAAYLFKYLSEMQADLQHIAEDSAHKRAELEAGFEAAVRAAKESCREVLAAAETLLSEISDYASAAQAYSDLLSSLPDDAFKENLLEEYKTYQTVFDASAVRALKERAARTLELWEEASEGPRSTLAPRFAEGNPLDLHTREASCPEGKLLAEYAERYRKPKETGDRSLLDALKKLAAKSAAPAGKEESRLKNVSEGDVGLCFGRIDALAQADKTADVSGLSAFSVGGADSSDSEISEQTAAGMNAAASFFAGFGDVLSDLGNLLLETEYLSEMFSCATDTSKSVSLTGNGLNLSPAFGNELEYLIFGQDSLAADHAAAVAAVSAVRFVTNLIFAYSSSYTQSVAAAIAATVAGWTGIGVPIVKNVVLICWTVAETAADMKCLLDGESVAVVKTKETWHLSAEGLRKELLREGAELLTALPQTGGAADASAEAPQTGFPDLLNRCTYRDCLTLLLGIGYPLQKKSVLCRCAKLMQINVGAQDPGFVLPDCWTMAYVRCSADVKTLFLGGAVRSVTADGIRTDFGRMGEGSHAITVYQMAAY